MNSIESIIQLANDFFSSPVNQQNFISQVKQLLHNINPNDINLSEKMQSLKPQNRWTTEDIYTVPEFSIGVFMIAEGNSIPLHDHPSMHIIMQVLTGNMRITSYDWEQKYPWSGLAHQTYDTVLNADHETIVVQPDYGNLHQIEALDDCAFIDLTFPPYTEEQGRCCNYYQVEEIVETNDQQLFRLCLEN